MISDVKKVVGDAKYMTVEQAERITALIKQNNVHDVLELGFYHGVSTCYIADAVSHVTAIDRVKPAGESLIEGFLDELDLREKVTIFYEPTSYVWRLMKMLEEDQTPRFDLVYIDGAHDWATDGFAFFLSDKLLRPGGWMVFDDLPWTYASSPALNKEPWVQAMTEEARSTPQVQRIFDLLVKTHPSYDVFREEGQWGLAQKTLNTAATGAEVRVVREVEVRREKYGLGAVAVKAAHRASRRLKGQPPKGR